MAAPASPEAFLDLVRRSELIPTDRLDTFLADAQLPATAQETAALLVEAGLLTRYQAQNLLAGKHRGFRLGPYKVLEPIARGGMGAVYLAEHTTLCRRVAIKVFPSDRVADEVALQRFYREGRAAAALDHANIVRVHDITRAGNVHYLVMEYVEGVTLERLVHAAGPLPVERAVGYVTQAAAALQHAADHGVVHRDVKPANLLVDGQDTVKVLDMGLARFFDDRGDDLTRQVDDGAVLGTADYIAPEQALNSRVDSRADIYSLGATLYTLLGGRPPFCGKTTTQKLLAHQLKSAQPLHEVRPCVPRELSAVVEKMMAKKPEDRYQTPAEVIAALAPWTPGSAAAPAPVPPHIDVELVAFPPPRRPRWPVAVAAGVLTLCCAAGGGFWMLAASGSTAPPPDGPPAVAAASQVSAPPPAPAPAPPTPAPATPAVKPAATPAVKPAATAPAAPAPLYRLDLSGHTPLSWRKSRKDGLRQPTDVPAGWRSSAWDADSTSEFLVERIGGALALGLRHLTGKPAGLWWLDCDMVPGGRRYHLHLSYLTQGEGRCTVRLKPQDEPVRHLITLPATADQWRSTRLYFEQEEAGPIRLQFHNPTVGADNGLFLRNVRLIDAGGLDEDYVIARRDWRQVEPFRVVVNRRDVVERDGQMPYGFTVFTNDPTTHGEATLERVNDRPVLAVRNLKGKPTTVLSWSTPRIQEGRSYRAVVEYRTDGNAAARARVRQGREVVYELEPMKNTDGRWHTFELEFEANASAGSVVELFVRGAGPEHTLQIGRVELIERAVE